MLLKYISLVSVLNLATVAHAAEDPSVSIKCFGVKEECDKIKEVAIINNSSTRKESNLVVSCANKDDPDGKPYIFSSFDLDPKEVKCVNVADYCVKTKGFFVRYNVEVILTSKDYPPWNTANACAWKGSLTKLEVDNTEPDNNLKIKRFDRDNLEVENLETEHSEANNLKIKRFDRDDLEE